MAPLEQFTLLGDSITQKANDQSRGFALASELQEAYVRRLDIINRGFGGYNTDHILTILSDILPTPSQARIRFLIQTIWFGANDANKSKAFIDQYVPLDRFKQNLKAIINHHAVVAHKPNIILMTPPPVEENLLEELQRKMKDEMGIEMDPPVGKAEDARTYAEATKEVAGEESVAVVDVWAVCIEKTGWKDGDALPGTIEKGRSEELAGLLHDGLHLGPDGYKVVFEELLRVIKGRWPVYVPYGMPYAVKVPWEVGFGDQLWDVKQ